MRVGVFVGVLLAAFNMRIAIVEVGPLLEEMRADTGMDRALAGALTTIPFLCMGLFSLFGAAIVARLGLRRLVAWCLVVIAAGTALRGVMPTAPLIVAMTVPIGVGIALAGVALPVVVKASFERGGGAMGAYVAVMNVGGATAGLVIVSLAAALGGWRAAFAVTAVPAALALPLWLRSSPRVAPQAAIGPRRRRRPTAVAVVLALVFGLQSFAFSGLIAWVAVIYREAGWSAGEAAVATAAILLIGIPASIVVPALSDGHDRRVWAAASAGVVTAGLLGIALAPDTLAWLWITLYAVGNGALFPLALTLPLDVSSGEGETAELVGWTLGLGYLLSCSSPVVVGALRDATGGFVLPMLMLAGFAALTGALALRAVRPRKLVASNIYGTKSSAHVG